MLAIDQIVEGKIEAIAFGGEGILRYQRFVIFVPFTAVGDEISCHITEVKRSFARGKLLELKQASPQRTKPRCPYFESCGGCQLQHMSPQAQFTYKLSAVKDALSRIGHLSLPPFHIVPAQSTWAYRRHITLHLRPKNEAFEAGYIGQNHHSLVTIQTCPIFNESQDLVIAQLQELIKQIPNPKRQEGKVTLLKNHHRQFILFFQFDHPFPFHPSIFQSALQHSPHLAGLIFQTPNRQIILGDPYSEQKLEGLNFRFSPLTFSQNHVEQSIKIYQKICQLAEQVCRHHILDLYCGFGLTSLLLAQRGHLVTGVEYNPEAIRLAQENAVFNHVKNVCFIQGDVKNILPNWFKTHSADLVIVNPPRQGVAKAVLEILLKKRPRAIIYVSCMPSTLARDLQALSSDYYIQEGYVYDMFPQTAHVETLVYLETRKKE